MRLPIPPPLHTHYECFFAFLFSLAILVFSIRFSCSKSLHTSSVSISLNVWVSSLCLYIQSRIPIIIHRNIAIVTHQESQGIYNSSSLYRKKQNNAARVTIIAFIFDWLRDKIILCLPSLLFRLLWYMFGRLSDLSYPLWWPLRFLHHSGLHIMEMMKRE